MSCQGNNTLDMSPFKKRVIEITRLVPEGKVVSYGQVALLAGVPRGARQVGWILNSTEGDNSLPWWRVINNQGKITIKGTKYNDKSLQKKLLEAEGILVSQDFTLDIETYRFIPTLEFVQKMQLPEEYIKKLREKYNF